jgi:hypothetical protein
MPVLRAVLALARGALFVLACVAVLLSGALTLIAATVGVCAVIGVLLYGVAHLFAYCFGISLRWGLVSACGLLFVGVTAGALINDLRMIRRLALSRVGPADEP